jgi:hypothetical protein
VVAPVQGETVRGRTLVLADGATSRMAMQMGYCTEPPKGVCSRAYVEGGTHNADFDGVPPPPYGPRLTCHARMVGWASETMPLQAQWYADSLGSSLRAERHVHRVGSTDVATALPHALAWNTASFVHVPGIC